MAHVGEALFVGFPLHFITVTYNIDYVCGGVAKSVSLLFVIASTLALLSVTLRSVNT